VNLSEGKAATLAVLDLDTSYRIDASGFLSMGHSTPFDGRWVQGQCVLTMVNGRTVWQREESLSM
jgi:dihydroorotase